MTPPTLSAAIHAGWESACVGCYGCKVLRMRVLSKFPPAAMDLPIKRFVAQLRCQACGQRASSFSIERAVPGEGYGSPKVESERII